SYINGTGAPTNDNWNPNRCDKVREDDTCFESCVATQLESGERPPYDLGGFGQGSNRRKGGMTGINCQGYARSLWNDWDGRSSGIWGGGIAVWTERIADLPAAAGVGRLAAP